MHAALDIRLDFPQWKIAFKSIGLIGIAYPYYPTLLLLRCGAFFCQLASPILMLIPWHTPTHRSLTHTPHIFHLFWGFVCADILIYEFSLGLAMKIEIS